MECQKCNDLKLYQKNSIQNRRKNFEIVAGNFQNGFVHHKTDEQSKNECVSVHLSFDFFLSSFVAVEDRLGAALER